jgi:hypothetical protein
VIEVRSRRLAAVALVVWTVLIWQLCTTTRVHVSGRLMVMRWLTNLTHAPMFGVWAALLAVVLRPGVVPGPDAPEPRARRAFLTAAALAIAYGVLIEWRQASIPGRTASALDVVTDSVGALGVPWALATGALISRRAVGVFLVASVAALLATLRW